MKRFAAVTICLLALAACAPKPQDVKITPELLADPAKIQSISDRLPPQDRPVFARYQLSRAAAASPLGAHAILILAPGGKDPATVGEALILTRKVIALELQRDIRRDAATKRQDAISNSPAFNTPDGIRDYNAAVADYNGASEDFDAKLKAMQAAK